MLKSRFAGEALASDLRAIPLLKGARDRERLLGRLESEHGWFRSGSKSIVGFCLCRRPALPRANNLVCLFYIPSKNATRIFLFHPLHSSHIITATFSSISLFTSLRLGLGRLTRFPTRLPAYHSCQHYHLPPVSKKHESPSRVPWPYISTTKMSSSEDDKPLVKGSLSITCTPPPRQE
jgi:hypothetical protein